MPRLSIAQWTGITITVIVVLGKDFDILYAVPLGILSSLLATLFSELANFRVRPLRFVGIRRSQ
jgi:hypothetical protein